MCNQDRIPGIAKLGRAWAIPKDAEKPADARKIKPGLYEQVINTKLQSELAEIPQARKDTAPIDKAEASRVLAQYLADIVQKCLDNVLDNGGDIAAQVALTNQVVKLIQTSTQDADFAALSVTEQTEQLLALLQETDPQPAAGKTAADLTRPETSVAQSDLSTGAAHEPQMYTELKAVRGYANAPPHQDSGDCCGGRRYVEEAVL